MNINPVAILFIATATAIGFIATSTLYGATVGFAIAGTLVTAVSLLG